MISFPTNSLGLTVIRGAVTQHQVGGVIKHVHLAA